MDKSQDNYNEWVGTSVGLYATSATADFDLYSYRYGFAPMKVEGRNNWYGVTYATKTPGRTVTNSATGDWLMMAGVDLGGDGKKAGGIEVNVASAGTASLEVWLDNIGGNGTKAATVAIPNTGGADTWKNVTASLSASGQHDVYLRWVGGANSFFVNTIKFTDAPAGPSVSFTSPTSSTGFVQGSPIPLEATATTPTGTISNVKFYNGTTLLSTDDSSPYSYSWTTATAGSHVLKAVATDNSGTMVEDTITIKVNTAQGPYQGKVHPIPGTIQLEEYDEGGNGFAYMDATPGSQVTPVVTFRPNEDVDLEVCTDTDGGYNLGFATAGEWVEYTVNVTTAGAYDLDLRVACDGEGRTVSLSMDGAPLGSAIAIPTTGGWQTWSTFSVKNLSLKAGQQVLRLTIGATDYVNMNYITFSPSVPTGLETLSSIGLELYPNPFHSDGLQVRNAAGSLYRILDMQGIQVEQGKADDGKSIGRSLIPGVYMLFIENEQGRFVQKILRQ